MQKNILEYLDRSAQRVPDKIAFYGEKETLTFRQLRRQAQSIGSQLAQMGYCTGERILQKIYESVY